MDLSPVVGNLLTPPVLFFALGVLASLLRSDLEFPLPMTKALSLYLLFAIGLHGGAELAAAGLSWSSGAPLLAGVGFSALAPLAAFFVLRRRVGVADAAAIGATYGSISAVTFVTACGFADQRGLDWSGHMVAAMALMESPAILVGVLLARHFGPKDADPRSATALGALVREAFLNGSVFLLLGSLAVGALAGEEGWRSVAPFVHEPFKGVLCLFLLDMGLIAARRLDALRSSGPVLLAFAVLAPLLQAALALGVARLLGLERGDALLFVVLCASASYIAVPAAIRAAVPSANPSLFLPMSLAVTFPFNIAVGIPLYMAAIEALWSHP